MFVVRLYIDRYRGFQIAHGDGRGRSSGRIAVLPYCGSTASLMAMAARSYVLGLQARGVVTFPVELRRRLFADQPGAQLHLTEVRDGVFELSATVPVPADQAWFWSERWQRMEREAQADIDAGKLKSFENLEDFVADLDN